MVKNLELLSVVVMSMTAILTAWSGFQSARWSAEQANNYGSAADAQTESVRTSNEARQATSIDLAVFIAWLEATTDGEEDTAQSIYDGMPERLRVATDAWLAEDPFENPDAPTSPFVMESYVVPAAEVSEELAQTAEQHTIAAREATELASDYVLTTVLFATVLFFASISSKLNGDANKWVMLSLSAIGLIVGVVVLLSLPRAP
jgi:type II secretory pathway pseudopilin PulG